MGRPIRNLDPEKIRLMTIRTERAELLMLPNRRRQKDIRNIIGGVVGKYQKKLNIKIFGYIFTSNHYHILYQASEGNSWLFAQNINREIAKRVNRTLNREGHFWQRRYSEQIVLDVEDGLEALLYIICNPVSHGLIKDLENSPFLSSYDSLVYGKKEVYSFTNYSEYNKALRNPKKKKVDIRDYQELYSIEISSLPYFEGVSIFEMREILRDLISSRVKKLVEERRTQGKGFLGKKAILDSSPFSHPKEVKKSSRPLCYSKSFESIKKYLDWFYAFLADYQEASKAFRMGILNTIFPKYSIRPPLLYELTPL